MTKFQVNQKVYLPKFGLYAFVNKIRDGRYLIKDENKKKGWINEQYLVEFIEPKFKVGDIVYCYPSSRKPGYMEDTCEIVKFALNKKKSAYSYLAFNDNGYIFCFQEDEVLLVGKCRNCGAKI